MSVFRTLHEDAGSRVFAGRLGRHVLVVSELRGLNGAGISSQIVSFDDENEAGIALRDAAAEFERGRARETR